MTTRLIAAATAAVTAGSQGLYSASLPYLHLTPSDAAKPIQDANLAVLDVRASHPLDVVGLVRQSGAHQARHVSTVLLTHVGELGQ